MPFLKHRPALSWRGSLSALLLILCMALLSFNGLSIGRCLNTGATHLGVFSQVWDMPCMEVSKSCCRSKPKVQLAQDEQSSVPYFSCCDQLKFDTPFYLSTERNSAEEQHHSAINVQAFSAERFFMGQGPYRPDDLIFSMGPPPRSAHLYRAVLCVRNC